MNKKDFINLFSNSSNTIEYASQLSLFQILVILFISFLLGITILQTYKKIFFGVLYQRSFAVTLLLVTMVSSVVTIIISGNLALSLGMVGALSIIRYRTAVKDPIDAAFIFWAVSIGIANGVGAFKISIISTIFIILILIFINKFLMSSSSKLLFINSNKNNLVEIEELLKKYAKNFRISSNIKEHAKEQIVYDIIFKFRADENKFLNELKSFDFINSCSLVSKNSNNLDA